MLICFGPVRPCWVLHAVAAVMSQFLHMDPDVSSQNLRQEKVSILSVIFLVSLQPPAASEPDQTPRSELLNPTPLNATTSLSFFLRLSVLPASCRPLGELLNSRTSWCHFTTLLLHSFASFQPLLRSSVSTASWFYSPSLSLSSPPDLLFLYLYFPSLSLLCVK